MSFNQQQLSTLLKERIHGITRAGKTGNGMLDHPLMNALESAQLSGDQLKKFCDVRYNAASEFELLLERALELAQADPTKADLAKALHDNLCDERGLDYETHQQHGKGAHSEWRKDFLDKLGVKVEPERSNHFPLYHFTEQDDFPTLVGLLLAAEMTIPSEAARILKQVRRSFPELVTNQATPDDGTPEQLKTTLYLQDHVRHDTAKHMPELLDAIVADIKLPQERLNLIKAVDRFVDERKGLYDFVQKEVGLATPEPAREGRSHS